MLRVRDIMTTDVKTLSPQSTLREAMELFAHEHVSGAPVITGGAVVGVVTSTDLLSFAATLRGTPADRDGAPEADLLSDAAEDERDELDEVAAPSAYFSELWESSGEAAAGEARIAGSSEWDALDDHDVSEVMTRDVWTLPSTAHAREAADMMREHGIHRVLVTDDGALAGIVTALDIARATSERKFQNRAYVFGAGRDF
jgi:CBS domain-containing protein